MAELKARTDASHLRAEVWSNRSKSVVAVAFGGTVFSSAKDWKSNLHWFNPFQHDEYTLVVDPFGPQFAKLFAEKEKTPGWEFLKTASISATGHSLGGGLAEEFAYALPANLRRNASGDEGLCVRSLPRHGLPQREEGDPRSKQNRT